MTLLKTCFLLACGALPLVGVGSADHVLSVSPDGRNSIRLRFDPLSYEVARDGVSMVLPTRIGMTVDGVPLSGREVVPEVVERELAGTLPTPVYKKASVDLSAHETCVNFGDWCVCLIARNDGVAYRFETKRQGSAVIEEEESGVTLPAAAHCSWHETANFGCEESPVKLGFAADIRTEKGMVYLPLVAEKGGKCIAVTDADVCDYPVWNLVRASGQDSAGVRLKGLFAKYPCETYRSGLSGWDNKIACEPRARWEVVRKSEEWLVKAKGPRTFPWRAFLLADESAKLMESDLVLALARPSSEDADFSWVKPGKVTWEWWNAWDNIGDPLKGGADGCTTEVYRRFFDLAAEYGVEYVIFDEGWSKKLDIWHLNENVDLKGLIEYGASKGVGTILWMAWGQIVGDEEHVAQEFAKLGIKGFKVDFMDRGDAACERFYWDFADACAKYRLLVDYHGAHRPTGLSRAFPNVINYEGVHGLEQMKFYGQQDILANDVAICFTRMSAGPMDYTPGAMNNYPVGHYPTMSEKDVYTNPGSIGTRSRQMAMMALYEAPLQMLCDSVKNYRANAECFAFMAKTPVVWDKTVGLGGSPSSYAVVARQSRQGIWYVSGITDKVARRCDVDLSFLGAGEWNAEIFRDKDGEDVSPTEFVHEYRLLKAGEKMSVAMSAGGGFVLRLERK